MAGILDLLNYYLYVKLLNNNYTAKMSTCKHTQFTICTKNFNTISWLINNDCRFIFKNDNLKCALK